MKDKIIDWIETRALIIQDRFPKTALVVYMILLAIITLGLSTGIVSILIK